MKKFLILVTCILMAGLLLYLGLTYLLPVATMGNLALNQQGQEGESPNDHPVKAEILPSFQSDVPNVTWQTENVSFDGQTLSGTLTIHASQPLWILPGALQINGVSYSVKALGLEEAWTASPLDPTQTNTSFDMTATLETAISMTNGDTLAFPIILLAPKVGFVTIDIQSDVPMAWRDIDEATKQGSTPLDRNEPWPALVSSRYFTDVNEAISDTDIYRPINSVSAYTQYANMVIACEVTPTFIFQNGSLTSSSVPNGN